MLQASQFWLVHTLEDSLLFLGYVGLANAAPAILLNLFGGVFADRLDKRRLIMITQTILGGLIFLLATLTLMDVVQVWHVISIAFVAGGVNAFDQSDSNPVLESAARTRAAVRLRGGVARSASEHAPGAP